MRLYPGDFCFKQADPFRQLVMRKAVKRFQRQLTGSIGTPAGAVIIVHRRMENRASRACCQLVQRLGLRRMPRGQQRSGK